MKYLKKLFILLLAFIYSVTGINAQVSVKLHQPPPGQLNVEHLWNIDLNNDNDNTFRIRLNAKIIEESAGLVFEINSSVFIINPGFIRVSVSEISPLNIIHDNIEIKGITLRTGSLPFGNYEICINVIGEENGEILGNDCIQQEVANPSPPQLISPENGDILLDDFPMFIFMPSGGIDMGLDISYNLKIVEVIEGQAIEEAIISNPSWFEVNNIKNNNFQFPVNARTFEPDKKFCWQVTPVLIDRNLDPSEVWSFTGKSAFIDDVPKSLLSPVLVDCRIEGWSFLLSPGICTRLGGVYGTETDLSLNQIENKLGRFPHVDILKEVPAGGSVVLPFLIFWKDPTDNVSDQDKINLNVQSEIQSDQVVGMIFSCRAVLDSVWHRIGFDNDSSDGWNCMWDVSELQPGFYETRVRAVNRNNRISENHFFTRIGTDEKFIDEGPAVSNIVFSVTQGDINSVCRQAQTARDQIKNEEDEIKRLRKEMDRESSESRAGNLQAGELERIDRIIDQIPDTFKDTINILLDSLRRIRVQTGGTPDTVALNKAVDDAQKRLDDCNERLKNLKSDKQKLLKDRDDLKSRQDDLLNQMDKLHSDNGWPVGGHGYHKNGRRWWGYVGDENSNTKLEPQYSNLRNQIDGLNKSYMDALQKLKDIEGPPDKIDRAEQDCRRLSDLLKQAKDAKARGDQYEAFRTNINDICRQIKSLLQQLLDWCNNNPGDCSFENRLRNILTNCPDDSAAWNRVWNDINQVVKSKKEKEAQLRRDATLARRRADEIQRRIDEARERIREQERIEKEKIEEAERLRRKRQKEIEEAQRQEERRLRRQFSDGPPLDEPQDLSEKQIMFGLAYIFNKESIDNIMSAMQGDCKGKCKVAIRDILADGTYVQFVRTIANSVWLGTALAALSPAIGIGGKIFTACRTALSIFLNQPDVVPIQVTKDYHFDGIKRGQRLKIDCKITFNLAYNPSTGYVMGIIRCKCCEEEKILFIKYKANKSGMPIGNPITQWLN